MWPLASLFSAIIIGAIVMTAWTGVIQIGQNRQIYAAAAGEFQDLLSATNKYVSANNSQLASWVPAGGTWLDLNTLIANNLLPPGFSSQNPFGQVWGVYLRQPQSGQIQAIVLSSSGTALALPALTAVAGMAGSQSGFVPPDNVLPSINSGMAVGNMGKWRMSLAGLPNPGSGHFYGLGTSASNTQYNNDYLYRTNISGHPEYNTMNATLNMGGNDINNAGAGRFNGRIGTSGVDPNSVPPGWIGGVATFDVSARGTIGAGGANQNPAAWINSSGNGHTDGDFSTGHDLSVGNTAWINNAHVASGNNLWVGNNTVYGDGSNIALRTPGAAFMQHQDGSLADVHSQNNYMNTLYANGAVLPAGESLYIGSGSLYGDSQNLALRPANGTVYLQNRFGGGDANLYGGQIETTKGVLYDRTDANPGYGCGPNGRLAGKYDGSGDVLACVNGTWKSITSKPINTYVPPTTNGFGGYAHPNPATGGYWCEAGTNDTFSVTLWYGDYGYSSLHLCEPQ